MPHRRPNWTPLALALLAWTLMLGASLARNRQAIDREIMTLARVEGQTALQKDLALRLWATGHGGVYVPMTDKTGPNPYLHVPDRDVVTTTGQALTLRNPATMIRETMEEYHRLFKVKTRITGHVYLNPANAPDAWEKKALDRVALDFQDYDELVEIDGAPYLRLMQPMRMEPGCMKCHGDLGIAVGELRGGTDIAVPLAPYQAASSERWGMILGLHLGLWAMGVVGAVTIAAMRERQRVAELATHDAMTGLVGALDQAPSGIALTDGDGRLTYVNRAWSDAEGASAKALVGRAATDALRLPPALGEAGPVEATALEVERLDAPDAPNRWLRVTRQPLDAGPDSPHRAVLTMTDITPERRAEQERRELDARAADSQRMEAIGKLAGGLAHDFNNMLTPIFSCAELLREAPHRTADDAELLDSVTAAAQRCRDIVQQLLAYSRHQAIAPEAVDVHALLNRFASTFGRTLGDDFHVLLTLCAEQSHVLADAGQLEQVVLNLAINARDAMTMGGILSIATENTLDADGRPGLLIQLQDTGAGMGPEVLKRAFEPFFTTKAPGKGTGLGLAMVSGIVSRHDGSIVAHSEPGVGTTFRLWFPILATPVEAPAPGPTFHARPLTGAGRILLVEDEPMVRALTVRILARAGYQVTAAEGLAEVAALLSGAPDAFDLLLTDVLLGDGQGPQVADLVRARHPSVRVLYMSGYSAEFLGDRGIRTSDVDLLDKPFGPQELIQRIRKALGDE